MPLLGLRLGSAAGLSVWLSVSPAQPQKDPAASHLSHWCRPLPGAPDWQHQQTWKEPLVWASPVVTDLKHPLFPAPDIFGDESWEMSLLGSYFTRETETKENLKIHSGNSLGWCCVEPGSKRMIFPPPSQQSRCLISMLANFSHSLPVQNPAASIVLFTDRSN